ncbi:DUF4124 domain-containing protein [Undibacterium cyanobacteriorum]|uniref:DUF4124 domain-containing protein n=1 Tax=Undibacterium cyanobacteriorum TaxID=3073561 RepID=A0ABY9RK27_9BURK|nr:DUF4124 domain-containing protein [Undibacterium sp. 20NA77.5]WMW80620.1 DUF4124 domain-containing protein [Undibacterium sp. 20NA77.5]
MSSSNINRTFLNSLLTLSFVFCPLYGSAAQVYKWVDENGKVHYGDRTTAPNKGKKVEINVKVAEKPADKADSKNPDPRAVAAQHASSKLDNLDQTLRPLLPTIASAPSIPPAPPIPPMPQKKNSKPVDPSRVPSACKGLVDQIAKVERGSNWEGLAKSYNAACPGISYECNNYRSNPEKSFCQWVERTDSTILSTNNYQ